MRTTIVIRTVTLLLAACLNSACSSSTSEPCGEKGCQDSSCGDSGGCGAPDCVSCGDCPSLADTVQPGDCSCQACEDASCGELTCPGDACSCGDLACDTGECQCQQCDDVTCEACECDACLGDVVHDWWVPDNWVGDYDGSLDVIEDVGDVDSNNDVEQDSEEIWDLPTLDMGDPDLDLYVDAADPDIGPEDVQYDQSDEYNDVAPPVCPGGCFIDESCYQPGEVNPSGQCHVCDPMSASDAWTINAGAKCDDGLFCTVGDSCGTDGVCTGTAMDCDDGIACNGTEVCDELGDACAPGATTCEPTWLCDVTQDLCVKACTGCVIGGNCYGDGQRNPLDQCEVCDVATDAGGWTINAGAKCDDGLFCTVGDSCGPDGVCTGTALDCDDGIACNGTEVCDELVDACAPGATTCEPTWLCDVTQDLCVKACTGCVIGGNCYGDGQRNLLDQCEVCDVATDAGGWTINAGANCDDGLFCTVGDSCGTDGVCTGTAMDCDDGIACNGTEVCDELGDACAAGTSTCPEGHICDLSTDTCVLTYAGCLHEGNCCAGCIVDDFCYAIGQLNPSNSCQICEPLMDRFGWTARVGVACDDGLFCTLDDTCDEDGLCLGEKRDCSGGRLCASADACDEVNDTCFIDVLPECASVLSCFDMCIAWGDVFPYFISEVPTGSFPTAGGSVATLRGFFPGKDVTVTTLGGYVETLPVIFQDKTTVVFITPVGSVDTSVQVGTPPGLPETPFAWYPEPTMVDDEPAVVPRPDVPLKYGYPVILEVSGCAYSNGVSTFDCAVPGGDLITMNGINFGLNLNEITVAVNGVDAPVIAVDHEQIIFILPPMPEGGWNLPVSVIRDGKHATMDYAISYVGPVVSDIDPPVVSAMGMEEFVITGYNFDYNCFAEYGSDGVNYSQYCALADFETLSCETPPGLGVDMPVTVRCSGIRSAPNHLTLSYTLPEIWPGALRGEPFAAGQDVYAPPSFPAQVFFEVSGLPEGAFDQMGAWVRFGDELSWDECVLPYAANLGGASRVMCYILDSNDLWERPMETGNFQIMVPGGASAWGTDAITLSPVPELVSTQGCDATEPFTGDCPTTGATITATFSGAVELSTFLLNGSILATKSVAPNAIEFVLPPGAGVAQLVVMMPDGSVSPVHNIKYAKPVINEVSGCPMPDPPGTKWCPIEGGLTLELHGANFGPNPGTVLVGSKLCTEAVHSPGHDKVTCTLPAGTGKNLPVQFFDSAGQYATGGKVSYVE